MQIMIDGHNLIPNIPGLSLSDLDDEQRLIEMVQEYCRKRRQKAEIYFDNAPPGLAGMRSMGGIKVKFAAKGRTADQDIKDRLTSLGKAARNWQVVTSDQSIQLAARAARAQVRSSGDFAVELGSVLSDPGAVKKPGDDAPLSDQEVAQWMKIFKQGKPE
jgi:hypothetical protein